MLPDLNTLLLVRFGVDALIAFAFWGQMRRYPGIGGPGWWALGAVMSILGSIALMQRVAGDGPLMAASSAALLFLSHACAWVGVRSYLRLPLPWRTLGAMLIVLVGLQTAVALFTNQPEQYQVGYAVSIVVLASLVLRDLFGQRSQRFLPEYQALAILIGCEAGVLLVMTGLLLWSRTVCARTPSRRARAWPSARRSPTRWWTTWAPG
jgi:two-component system, cell cycle sensor histidine kinase and response regulator CckA